MYWYRSSQISEFSRKNCWKGGQKLVHVQATVGVDVPGRPLCAFELDLSEVSDLSRNDFAVNGAGDLKPGFGIAADEAEVDHILEIVIVLNVGKSVLALQHRLNHSPDARFAEFVGELVEVRDALEDKVLFGPLDEVAGDGLGAVPLEFEAKPCWRGRLRARVDLG